MPRKQGQFGFKSRLLYLETNASIPGSQTKLVWNQNQLTWKIRTVMLEIKTIIPGNQCQYAWKSKLVCMESGPMCLENNSRLGLP